MKHSVDNLIRRDIKIRVFFQNWEFDFNPLCLGSLELAALAWIQMLSVQWYTTWYLPIRLLKKFESHKSSNPIVFASAGNSLLLLYERNVSNILIWIDSNQIEKIKIIQRNSDPEFELQGVLTFLKIPGCKKFPFVHRNWQTRTTISVRVQKDGKYNS